MTLLPNEVRNKERNRRFGLFALIAFVGLFLEWIRNPVARDIIPTWGVIAAVVLGTMWVLDVVQDWAQHRAERQGKNPNFNRGILTIGGGIFLISLIIYVSQNGRNNEFLTLAVASAAVTIFLYAYFALDDRRERMLIRRQRRQPVETSENPYVTGSKTVATQVAEVSDIDVARYLGKKLDKLGEGEFLNLPPHIAIVIVAGFYCLDPNVRDQAYQDVKDDLPEYKGE